MGIKKGIRGEYDIKRIIIVNRDNVWGYECNCDEDEGRLSGVVFIHSQKTMQSHDRRKIIFIIVIKTKANILSICISSKNIRSTRFWG